MSLIQSKIIRGHLHNSGCSYMEIFSFQLRLDSEGRNDTLLGHMIVLLQHDWPKREKAFTEVIERIIKQGGLKYPIFFNYVIRILSFGNIVLAACVREHINC